MTETINYSKILDEIQRLPKDRLSNGVVSTEFLPVSVAKRAKFIILDDGRNRFSLPRLTDIYRHCVDIGIEEIAKMTPEQIKEMDDNFTEDCQKMQCGFDRSTNERIFSIRQEDRIVDGKVYRIPDYKIRRLALKLGFEATFGE